MPELTALEFSDLIVAAYAMEYEPEGKRQEFVQALAGRMESAYAKQLVMELLRDSPSREHEAALAVVRAAAGIAAK